MTTTDADYSPADIPVVILCGGMGTRIREVSERLPKPLVEIGDRPVIWHIMKMYSAHGFRRFVLPLGFKGHQIKQYFLSYHEYLADIRIDLANRGATELLESARTRGAFAEDWEITCVETGIHTATAGRVRQVAEYLDAPVFALTYGDGVADLDITASLEYHRSHQAMGTVTGIVPTSRYGELTTEDDRVTNFSEKPEASDSWVNGGFFLFDREFADRLEDVDDVTMLEDEPLQKLAADDNLRVFRHRGFWTGMDTFRDWKLLNSMWDDGTAPWKVW